MLCIEDPAAICGEWARLIGSTGYDNKSFLAMPYVAKQQDSRILLLL
jgi:hypothetical protein